MVPGGHSGRRNLWEKEWKGKLEVSTEWCQLEGFWRIKQECFRGEGNQLYENCTLQEEYASWELDTGRKAKGGGESGSWEVQERLDEGGPNSRGGGGVKQNLYLIGGRGNGEGELVDACLSCLGGGYRSILEEADQCIGIDVGLAVILISPSYH